MSNKATVVHPVIVIGGGPAGLSAAHELQRAGIAPLVLERTAAVGDVWRNHYEGLRLNTGRWLSNLPGLRFPASAGRWPTKNELADQLALMPARGGFSVRTGTEVQGVQPGNAAAPWKVLLADGEELLAQAVVVATGGSNIPVIPQWQGVQDFAGRVLHARDFSRADEYRGKHVLVVGSGNTACEIATRLVPHAASVTLSVRRSPHLLPKSLHGVPFAALGVIARRLSVKQRDRFLLWLSRRWVGDLSAYGLPSPTSGVSQLGTVTPTLFMPFVDELKAGRIRLVGAIAGFDKQQVHVHSKVAQGTEKTSLQPDVVIAGTGYRTGLQELVRAPDLTDADGKPHTLADEVTSTTAGLFFIGYVNPVSGQLREIGQQAPRVAKAVNAYLRSAPVAQLTDSAQPITPANWATTHHS